MILNNTTSKNADFMITTANGREINFNAPSLTYQKVDLSRYRSPFSVQVTVEGNRTDMVNGLDESHYASVYSCNGTYNLSATHKK